MLNTMFINSSRNITRGFKSSFNLVKQNFNFSNNSNYTGILFQTTNIVCIGFL